MESRSGDLRAFPELVVVGTYVSREFVEEVLIRRLKQLEGKYETFQSTALWNTGRNRNNQIRNFLRAFQKFIRQKENNQIPYEQCFKEVFKMNQKTFSEYNIHGIDDLQKVDLKIKELFIYLQVLDEKHTQKEIYIEPRF